MKKVKPVCRGLLIAALAVSILLLSSFAAASGLSGAGEGVFPVITAPSAAKTASPTSSTVRINGEVFSFEAYNIEGSNYFKLRDFAMALNGTNKKFEVAWDGVHNAISLTSGMSYTPRGGELVPSGNTKPKQAYPTLSTVYFNGEPVSLTAYNIGGYNYFKLRDIGYAMNFSIMWDGAGDAINIESSVGYIEKEANEGVVYTQKVLVLNFDPIFEMAGDKKQHELMAHWHDPRKLAMEYVDAMRDSSHGNASYNITEWVDICDLPMGEDGGFYTREEYYNTLQEAIKWGGQYYNYPGWKTFGYFDYDYYLTKYNVYEKIESGQIDEVWVFTGPCIGTRIYESRMIGRSAYTCNSPPLVKKECRAFVCYIFNYERELGCMLENAGHRFESIMNCLFGRNVSRPYEKMNDWEKFTLYDLIYPGKSGCGNIHFAPNGRYDYDWGNPAYVTSSCNDWRNYPNMTGAMSLVNNETWGGGDMAAHHKWWFSCIPHALGYNKYTQKFYNWWVYFKYPVTNQW